GRAHPTAGRGAGMNEGRLLEGVRVLAVDDQPDTLEMVSAVLQSAGAEVQTANTVSGALAQLEKWRPDLIIADIGMPDEDGFTLIGKLRARAPEEGGAIPAIALTAYARVADRLRTLSAGYQMHVPKPVEPAELTAIVASLTGRTGKETER
ncbi:MAG: response regulator, partial [Acidobacteria bacterium]|nr:response regulator [Acidobacteriota bacterium]